MFHREFTKEINLAPLITQHPRENIGRLVQKGRVLKNLKFSGRLGPNCGDVRFVQEEEMVIF